MNVILNEPVLRRRYFLATTLTVTGLLILLLSSILLFLFPSSATTLPLLPVGSLAAIVGLRITNAWLRPPAPHTAITDALKGLGKSATLLHYHAPAKHLLICEHGIFTITAIPHPLNVHIADDDWHTTDRLLSAFQLALTYPSLKDPVATAKKEAAHAQAWISSHLPESETPITPLIALTSPNANLVVSGNQSIEIATTLKNRLPLKAAIRAHQNPTLSSETTNTLIAALK